MFGKILQLLNISKPYQSINGIELSQRLSQSKKGIKIIDVRSPQEFIAGHIPDAINIHVDDEKFLEKIRRLDQQKTYYVYCRSGARSARACKKMAKEGFTSLFNVKRGIKAWSGELKKKKINLKAR